MKSRSLGSGAAACSSRSNSSMLRSSRSTSSCFLFSRDSSCFCNRLAFAIVSLTCAKTRLRSFSTRSHSPGDGAKSHFRACATHSAHRSDSTPTRHVFPNLLQLLHGRMATSLSRWASSRRRTVGLEDRWVRWGGMEDGWFLGTRNLGGGASVRTTGF